MIDQIEAAQAWHFEIEQKQIGGPFAQQVNGLVHRSRRAPQRDLSRILFKGVKNRGVVID